MTYVADRRPVFDADSHILELPGWLEEFADAATRDAMRPLHLGAAGAFADRAVAESKARHDAGELLRSDADPVDVLSRKGWAAYGSLDRVERSRVLDALGFDAQLVFPTFAGSQFDGRDLDLLYGGTDALTRAMAAFCAEDDRLMAVAAVPWGDPDRTIAAVTTAIAEGASAIQFPTALPRGCKAPTHAVHDRIWELLEEHQVVALSHVGGGNRGAGPEFHDNGHPVTDFIGGGENIRAKDYVAISHTTQVFWGALILDGIFERHPHLRAASIEEGALWSVAWMQQLDMSVHSFRKSEPRLAQLPLKPSEYVHRQMKFTPFPGEPVGWMIEQAGADLYLFSSDYPHPEGTRDPIGRFEATMDDVGHAARERFYSTNFLDLFPAHARC